MDRFEEKNEPTRYFNYEDLVETVEAGNVTGDEIKKIIKDD